MADLENDVIAGIGEEQTATNVIYPYFDAAFRKFVVGKDCILNGLELSEDGLRLTAGSCLGMGFEGELKGTIVFEAAPHKIYGRFVINHSEELDHFYIETDPTSSTATPQNNILYLKGEYWLLLYENGERKVDRNYPENAVTSDYSTHLIEKNGVTPTIAASTEVEGDIPQSPLTYDKRVASTGFVNEAVKELIGYKMIKVPIYSNVSAATNNDERYKVGELTLERKANYVICTSPDDLITTDAGSNWTGCIGNLTDSDFFPAPNTKGYILIANKNTGGTIGRFQSLNIILVNPDGTVKNSSTGSYFYANTSDDFELSRISGWKINR